MECSSCGRIERPEDTFRDGECYGCYLSGVNIAGMNTLVDHKSEVTREGDERTGGETIRRAT